MTTKPGQLDLTIYQGATFNHVLKWRDENGDPINLTGFTARMQMRKSIDATAPFLSLTSGSGITLGGTAGTISIDISAADTAAITQSQGVYDLELVNGAIVYRLLKGNIIISKEVTR